MDFRYEPEYASVVYFWFPAYLIRTPPLISGLFESYCELIVHDAGRCKAGNALYKLWSFYEAGWKSLLNPAAGREQCARR